MNDLSLFHDCGSLQVPNSDKISLILLIRPQLDGLEGFHEL